MSEPSEEDGKGSRFGRLAEWVYTIDLPQGVKNQFGASGPELPQKCLLEGDRFLRYSTMLVYVSTAVAAIVYALGFVKLTESIPVHMHLSPRILPTIAMSPNEDFPWKYYAYCDRTNNNYHCPMKTWAISPEGCAKIFKADMKHLPQLNTAAGDGVFLPTVWRYEETSIKPTMSTITPTCDVNKTCTLSDRKDFCSCTERNESLFMPGIIEQQMTLVYQMHMEIPDLSVMAGGGVNTPMCEDFLIHDNEVDHQIERANCTADPHPLRCAMSHFDLSFIRCDVQLRSGGKLQGRNYNPKSSAQKIVLNQQTFKTAFWGQWKVDLTNVLHRVTEVNETSKQHPNKDEVEDPYICSFMSTGGSIMVHHFIDPVDAEWSWWNPWESLQESLACRLGLPSRMVAFHDRTRRWPCFRLRVEIEYFPLQAVDKTDIVIHDAKTGAATLQRHQHRGIKAVVAQGGGGTVQRFTWTSFIVGIFSIFDLWVARMFIMECVILYCLFGPASKLYHRALTKKVSLAQMMRAWACRSVSALWIHEAVQQESRVSKPGTADTHEELVTKITRLLKDADKPDKPDWLRSKFLKLRDPKNLENEESKDFKELRGFVSEVVSEVCADESDWHDWLLANESKGDLRSADLRAIFDLGVSSWEEFEDPPPPITHGVSNSTMKTEGSDEAPRQRRSGSSGPRRDPRAASLIRQTYDGLPSDAELESQ